MVSRKSIKYKERVKLLYSAGTRRNEVIIHNLLPELFRNELALSVIRNWKLMIDYCSIENEEFIMGTHFFCIPDKVDKQVRAVLKFKKELAHE